MCVRNTIIEQDMSSCGSCTIRIAAKTLSVICPVVAVHGKWEAPVGEEGQAAPCAISLKFIIYSQTEMLFTMADNLLLFLHFLMYKIKGPLVKGTSVSVCQLTL